MLLLLCTSAPLVLHCDRFNCGSRQVKLDPVDLVTVDYDITLRWQIPPPIFTQNSEKTGSKSSPITHVLILLSFINWIFRLALTKRGKLKSI